MSKKDELNKKPLNRRIAFRIYEETNLFYHKIDKPLPNKPIHSFEEMLPGFTQNQATDGASLNSQPSSPDKSLPSSRSLENDTLNVNISSSGIGFTCKEELNRGDYLMLRILLLSNMTVIQVCCKVVYCKPSNPYENDRYPYSIGAYFVNLTPTDKDFLNAHINRKRKQQQIMNGLLSVLLITILAMPAEAFKLFVSLCHHIISIFLHATHLALEYADFYLDNIIEHFFHTNPHHTQIIVFYIMLTFGLLALYISWLFIPSACAKLIKNQQLLYSRKKSSFIY